jgi:hypothetical protein
LLHSSLTSQKQRRMPKTPSRARPIGLARGRVAHRGPSAPARIPAAAAPPVNARPDEPPGSSNRPASKRPAAGGRPRPCRYAAALVRVLLFPQRARLLLRLASVLQPPLHQPLEVEYENARLLQPEAPLRVHAPVRPRVRWRECACLARIVALVHCILSQGLHDASVPWEAAVAISAEKPEMQSDRLHHADGRLKPLPAKVSS